MIGIQQQTLSFPVRKSARQASKSNLKSIKENSSPQISNDLDGISRLSVNSPSTRTRSRVSSKSLDSPKLTPKENSRNAGNTPNKSARTRRSLCKAVENNNVLYDAMQSKLGMDISLNILPVSPPSSPRKRTPCKVKPTCSPSKKSREAVESQENIPSNPNTLYVPSPARVLTPQRLNISPAKISSPSSLSALRRLDLSPAKVTSPCRANRIDEKSLCSPLKNVHSSPRRLNFTNSPSKLSSPTRFSKRIAESPCKHKKENQSGSHGNTGVRNLDFKLSSPSKLVSPLRLARQEGQCYHKVKQALHTAMPAKIVCREKETTQIQKFLDSHLGRKLPGSLYVSGAPGTGKTAVLSQTLDNVKKTGDCQVMYVNCMTLKNTHAIYKKVYHDLMGKEATFKTSSEAVRQLEKGFTSKGRMILMILDEIDQLDSKNQEVLYSMFEWPALTNSRLVLIGIANALDLTDRILPRLQARPHCRPQLLNFPPYTKDQIVSVLQDRLQKVQSESGIIMEPMAIQFCARKVAAMAGDMRRALDICRRAVDVVEASVRSQQVLKVADTNSPRKSNQNVPKKITVSHIANIVTEVYGSRMTAAPHKKQTIPLQQKLAVCTLLLLLKNGKAKEILLGKLHETYRKICKKRQIGDMDQSEFHSVCSLLETMGIMGLKKAKETRLVKVSLKMEERELEFALQDQTLMSSVLSDGIPR